MQRRSSQGENDARRVVEISGGGAEILYTQGDSDVISMPAGFCRHVVGKTLINVFHCDSAEIRFVGKIVITDISINQRIEFYLNNTIIPRPLTPHITPRYTHKMANVYVVVDFVTSLHPTYNVMQRPVGHDHSS